MISEVKLVPLIILVMSWLDQSSGYEICAGLFYETYFDSYTGLYRITTNYRHRYFNYHYYYGYSAKYCPDRCCTITDGTTYYVYYDRHSYSYRTCCDSYLDVTPSYKSSEKTASTTGLIIGCTVGGTLFAVVLIFSLFVARCMWKDRKRIDLPSTAKGSDLTDEPVVVMADNPEAGPSFSISTLTTAKTATEVTIT